MILHIKIWSQFPPNCVCIKIKLNNVSQSLLEEHIILVINWRNLWRINLTSLKELSTSWSQSKILCSNNVILISSKMLFNLNLLVLCPFDHGIDSLQPMINLRRSCHCWCERSFKFKDASTTIPRQYTHRSMRRNHDVSRSTATIFQTA